MKNLICGMALFVITSTVAFAADTIPKKYQGEWCHVGVEGGDNYKRNNKCKTAILKIEPKKISFLGQETEECKLVGDLKTREKNEITAEFACRAINKEDTSRAEMFTMALNKGLFIANHVKALPDSFVGKWCKKNEKLRGYSLVSDAKDCKTGILLEIQPAQVVFMDYDTIELKCNLMEACSPSRSTVGSQVADVVHAALRVQAGKKRSSDRMIDPVRVARRRL